MCTMYVLWDLYVPNMYIHTYVNLYILLYIWYKVVCTCSA